MSLSCNSNHDDCLSAAALPSAGWPKSKSAALDERSHALQRELNTAQAAVQRQTTDHQSLAAAKSALDATLASERRNSEEKLRLLSEASDTLKTEFKALAASALENNNANFLQLAASVLRNSQTQSAGELAQKEQAVKNLVEPIAQSLAGMNLQIQSLEQARSQAYGALTAQVSSLLDTQKALQTETGNLVKALREPQARGRWGELQLRRVLELAGMLEYCDFQEQETRDYRRRSPPSRCRCEITWRQEYCDRLQSPDHGVPECIASCRR